MKHLDALCLGLIGATLALPVLAQDYTEVKPRDVQLRAVTAWDYQPGYPRGTYPMRQEVGQAVIVSQPVPAADTPEWKKPRAVLEEPLDADLTPRTKTSLDATFQFGHYSYREPEISVKNKGLKYGFGAGGTAVIYGDWFLRIEGRYAFGDVDYTGSGVKDNNPDETFEVRTLAGKDFAFGRVVVAPYVGIGYRHLLNDMRGTSSTGAHGYRRESQYLFAPLGAESRYQINKSSRLSLLAEVDPLFQGWQFSQLSDVGPSYTDVTNKQNVGFGVRANLMYHFYNIGIGPYLNYWNIDDSNYAECDASNVCWVEPRNNTIEYGIQLKGSLY